MAVRGLFMLICLSLTACAGFRGGWESRPYIAQAAASAASESPVLDLPGLQLEVALPNRLRTYDTQVYLYVLPLVIDPRDAYMQKPRPGWTRVHLTVTPATADFIFHPAQARLQIAGKSYAGAAGFEFAQWDAQGLRVQQGGQYEHKPVASLSLAEAGRRYILSIDFPVDMPSPQGSELALDLSAALVSPAQPVLPLIRFQPVKWKQSYS